MLLPLVDPVTQSYPSLGFLISLDSYLSSSLPVVTRQHKNTRLPAY